MPKIVSVTPRLFHVPLDEVLVDAKHGDHTHFELITATVTLDDGIKGTGYSYTGGKGGFAIHAMIAHDLVPMLVGRTRRMSKICTLGCNGMCTMSGAAALRRLQSPPSILRCGICVEF